jgi:glutathione S-transferase
MVACRLIQVPTLVHNGARISQSIAILEYLEEVFPEHPLLPSDPVQRAVVCARAYSFSFLTVECFF